MQYKIPQNVGIEDKIVGPLSLRQLIIVAVGTGISWILFAIMSKLYEVNFIEYAVIAMPALLSAAFALVRINDQSLAKYIQLLMEFSMKPKRRIWDHRGISGLVSPDLGEPVAAVTSTMTSDLLAKSKKASNLRQLSLVLDSGGFNHVKAPEHRDMDLAQDENLVVQAYFGNDEKEKMNMYWRTIESHKKRLNFFAKLPTTTLTKGSTEAEMARQEIAKAKEAGEAARRQSISNGPAGNLSYSVTVKPKPSTSTASPASPAPKAENAARTPQPPKPEPAKPPMANPVPLTEKKNQAPAQMKPKAEPKPTPVSKPLPPNPTPSLKNDRPAPTRPPVPDTPKPAPQPMPLEPSEKPMPQTPKPQTVAKANPSPATQNKPFPAPNRPNPTKPVDQKPANLPVRQGHVNTTKPNSPAQYIPKPTPKPQPPANQASANPTPTPEKPPQSLSKPEPMGNSGEFKFEELKKGEIEINLD